MQQTFYIDRDEEITSLVDRLKKTKSTENIFVVPERAAILQSIVSLKLLKKEADKLEKQISIATGDEQGKLKIKKAGILLESVPMISRDDMDKKEEPKKENKKIGKGKETRKTEPPITTNKNQRLEGLGTNSFFDSESKGEKTQISSEGNKILLDIPQNNFVYQEKINVGKPKNRILDLGNAGNKANKFSETTREKVNSAENFVSKNNLTDAKYENTIFDRTTSRPIEFANQRRYERSKIQYNNGIDPHKEEVLDGFFNPSNNQPKPNLKSEKKGNKIKNKNLDVPVSKNIKKIFITFAVVSLVAILGVVSFVMLPRATVIISLKNDNFEGDVEIKGDVNAPQADTANMIIPVRVVELSDSLDYSAKSSGSKSSPLEKKAQGKVMIYNEFSSDSQPLVATTRIETSDGKIFRLVTAITVPGMSSNTDGSNTPGSVEADVIADQAGDAYNIGPDDFKIPGFQGSPKYDKFYAKSTDSMSGGGGDNSGPKIISQQDIDSAKQNAEDQMKNQLIEKVKNGLKPDEILLDEASQVDITQSKTSARINQVEDTFDYNVQASIKSLVFSEDDVKSLFIKSNSVENVPPSSITISYNPSTVDFDAGTVLIEAHGEFANKYQINTDDLKNKLLGKNENEVNGIKESYPQIQSVNLEFWPRFITSKIPKNPKRVGIVIN